MKNIEIANTGNVKTLLSVPWDTLDAISGGNKQNKVSNEQDAFSKVPIIYRAVGLRCNALVNVPLYVHNLSDNPIDAYPFEESIPLNELLWKMEASYLLAGAVYVLQIANDEGLKSGLQVINPFTMRVKKENGELKFWQEVDGNRYPTDNGYWTEEEMIYLRAYNPSDDIGAGISACAVSLVDAQLSSYLTKYSAQYFEGGGIPITMLSMPNGIQQAERERVESWFKQKIAGIKNAVARVLALSGDTKVTMLTQEFQSLAIDQLDAHVVNNVAYSFDIPKTVLTADSANFATAQTEYKSFISDTIAPRCKFYEAKLNKFLKDFQCKIVFKIQELSIMQENEVERSGALKNLVDSGMPINMALAVLGYDIPETIDEVIQEKPEEPSPPLESKSIPISGEIKSNIIPIGKEVVGSFLRVRNKLTGKDGRVLVKDYDPQKYERAE